jgi:hypothetical protein
MESQHHGELGRVHRDEARSAKLRIHQPENAGSGFLGVLFVSTGIEDGAGACITLARAWAGRSRGRGAIQAA